MNTRVRARIANDAVALARPLDTNSHCSDDVRVQRETE
jgi:hypothetical protein